MSLEAITLPTRQSDRETLQISQRAPEFLDQYPSTLAAYPVPLISATESSELWAAYEKLIYSCLKTGDDKSAHLCLERLIKRFGASNERIMGLRGLYQEAVANDSAALEVVLEEYESILEENPTNAPVLKRRIALLQSLGRQTEAIVALTEFLEMSPTDGEAWTELSSLYFAQSMYAQACFCLEEVLLILPNAWNIHARLGEVSFLSSFSSTNASETSIEKALTNAVRHYCRSIELCDGYLRGFYGLKLSTDRILETCHQNKKANLQAATENAAFRRLSFQTVQKLNQKATTELEKIIDRKTAGDEAFRGYDESEVISAKALLDRGTSKVQI